MAFEENLIASVYACNLVEEDDASFQKIGVPKVSQEQFLQQIAPCNRTEADISRRRNGNARARTPTGTSLREQGDHT